MRELFKDCGDILSICWLSFRVNIYCCFCYIFFCNKEVLVKVVVKEGIFFEGKYKFFVKYLDLGRKKNCEGVVVEGCEVYISNFDCIVFELDFCDVFFKYGKVICVNIL